MNLKKEGDVMRVVAFNGSSRKDGNTAILINYVFEELRKEGIDTELVQLAGKKIKGCNVCRKCFETRDKQCAVKNDIVNECIEKMVEADGIILGSPIYFADITPEIKALVDRAGYVSKANDDMLRRKVGAVVIAVRRAGAIHGFDSLNHFFFINQMIVPGSMYWNIGIGREKGEVENDQEGIQIMKVLGQNMAWVIKKLRV
jgi:multimeric flavodoxin WrbA